MHLAWYTGYVCYRMLFREYIPQETCLIAQRSPKNGSANGDLTGQATSLAHDITPIELRRVIDLCHAFGGPGPEPLPAYSNIVKALDRCMWILDLLSPSLFGFSLHVTSLTAYPPLHPKC